jgi:hypothetical protein
MEASARQLQLEFHPLIVKRFDVLVWRKDYFCASKAFARRVQDLGGLTLAGSARCISTDPEKPPL